MFKTIIPGHEPVQHKDLDELAEFMLDDSRRLITGEEPVFHGVEGATVVQCSDAKAGVDLGRPLEAEEYACLTHKVAARAIQTPQSQAKLLQDPKMVKALSHPLRANILRHLEALPEGVDASPVELCDLFEAPLGNVSYHVRTLDALGLVKLSQKVPRRGAIEHRYVHKSKKLGKLLPRASRR